jgi:cell wall-associated NlpC family hydrolase
MPVNLIKALKGLILTFTNFQLQRIRFINYTACFLLACLTLLSACKTHRKVSQQEPNRTRVDPKLGIELPDEINNQFIDEIKKWVNAPYKYGGTTRAGVDCSGFVQAVYKTVFNLSVAHQSEALYKKAKPVKQSELKEGDLLFFKIESTRISHVGMHITREYFIHASTKKGVVLSSLNEPYYKKTFEGYGTYR